MADTDRLLVPQHIAIMMDGNGRWAKQRGLPRTMGHRKGVDVLRQTVNAAMDAGVGFLTLFAFSTENWRRPETEVNDLMGLMKAFIQRDLADLHRQNVRIRIIGDREGLRGDILPLLVEAEETTKINTSLTLVIAFNYGSRDEIARAARKIARKIAAGQLDPETIDAQTVERELDTYGIPDPDFVIRTGGEQRLSNFLLWQVAYAEFVFIDSLWPDFTREDFFASLEKFALRERRFGGVAASVAGS